MWCDLHWAGRAVMSVAAVLLVACSGGAPAASSPSGGQPAPKAAAATTSTQWSPALAAVIEGAKREGKLQLSWSSATLGGNEGARRVQETMNRLFGTNLTVQFTPGPAMAQLANQIASEYAAGQPASLDVVIGAAAQLAPLAEKGVFEPVDWPGLLPGRITPEMVEGGWAIRLGTGTSGVTLNTQMYPGGQKPQTMDDFLKPEWRGKIASTPYAASFDTLAAEEVWGPQRVFDYLTRLKPQIAGIMRCGETERLAAGEYAALVMDCTGQDAMVWKAKGAPVDSLIPRDAAQKRYYYFVVPKNAQSPNAARLFTTFMLTPEGQQIAWDTWKIDLHYFPESNMAQLISPLEKDGVKFFEATIDWLLQHPEIEDMRQRMIDIITK